MMNIGILGFAITIVFSIVLADAATHVVVLEYGSVEGLSSIHRSIDTSKDAAATVDGVVSFWNALHPRDSRSGKKILQQSGMNLVPDLFNKPDSGIVLAVKGNGVDLQEMPFLSSLLFDETSESVGVMEIVGNNVDTLMSKVDSDHIISTEYVLEASRRHSETKGLSGIIINVSHNNSRDVDTKIAAAIDAIKQQQNKNIVVHIVIDDNDTVVSQRYSRRRLEEAAAAADADAADAAADADSSSSSSKYNGYYGYGYYNSNNEWVTPYKTMFQIQYFNIVMWTSIGLFIVLFYSIHLMINMPMEADTLLFGESAKFVGDD